MWRRLLTRQFGGSGVTAIGLLGLTLGLSVVSDRCDAEQRVSKPPSSDEDQRETARIRRILNGADYGNHAGQLESLGSSANPRYLSILEDKEANSLEVTRILALVSRQKGDRS